MIKISSLLSYNKEDIVYQIKNLDKLEDGCTYYFGGKSYKRLDDVYAEYRMYSTYGYKMFLKEKAPLCVIIDIIVGTNIPELSYKSPSSYLYFYYRDIFYSMDIESEIEDIRDHFKKGYTANEIMSTRKICLSLIKSTVVDFRSFIRLNLSGIASKEKLVRYFNVPTYRSNWSTMRIRRGFLRYSDVEIIKASYRVKDTQYFLCREGNELKYLSGTELLDIAIESVKNIKQ